MFSHFRHIDIKVEFYRHLHISLFLGKHDKVVGIGIKASERYIIRILIRVYDCIIYIAVS